jgi:hypothetical protein
MRKFISFLLSLSCIFISSAQVLLPQNIHTDGIVNAIAKKGDTLFLGGTFSRVYDADSSIQYGGVVQLSDKTIRGSEHQPNGIVTIAIPDGEGGYYIAGAFTLVGDSSRAGIAHIDSMGKVSPKLRDISINGQINALAFQNDTLVLGGSFTNFGTSGRNNLAAVNTNTGVILNWTPAPNGSINAITIVNGNIYVGGAFSFMGSLLRNSAAALNFISNTATGWNPDINGAVNAIAYKDNTVYIGGAFTYASSFIRNRIAAIDATTGAVSSWNPNADGIVKAFALSDSTLFVGGQFSTIGGYSRVIAELNLVTGVATAWHPTSVYNINAISIVNNAVFVGCDYNSFGAVDYFFELDKTNDTIVKPAISVNKRVLTVAVSGKYTVCRWRIYCFGGRSQSSLHSSNTHQHSKGDGVGAGCE